MKHLAAGALGRSLLFDVRSKFCAMKITQDGRKIEDDNW